MKTKKQKVALFFKYPSIAKLKDMVPKQRIKFIDDKLQNDLSKMKAKLNGVPFELLGTKKRPIGVRIAADKQIPKSLFKLPFIKPSLATGPLKKTTKTLKKTTYFCFKLIFQIQIEGKKKGIQTIEERFVLIKSTDGDKAAAKVLKEFKDREEPYLNIHGELVRWKFESIDDSFGISVEDRNEFNRPVEVFSKLKTRKLKKGNIWNGK